MSNCLVFKWGFFFYLQSVVFCVHYSGNTDQHGVPPVDGFYFHPHLETMERSLQAQNKKIIRRISKRMKHRLCCSVLLGVGDILRDVSKHLKFGSTVRHTMGKEEGLTHNYDLVKLTGGLDVIFYLNLEGRRFVKTGDILE